MGWSKVSILSALALIASLPLNSEAADSRALSKSLQQTKSSLTRLREFAQAITRDIDTISAGGGIGTTTILKGIGNTLQPDRRLTPAQLKEILDALKEARESGRGAIFAPAPPGDTPLSPDELEAMLDAIKKSGEELKKSIAAITQAVSTADKTIDEPLRDSIDRIAELAEEERLATVSFLDDIESDFGEAGDDALDRPQSNPFDNVPGDIDFSRLNTFRRQQNNNGGIQDVSAGISLFFPLSGKLDVICDTGISERIDAYIASGDGIFRDGSGNDTLFDYFKFGIQNTTYLADDNVDLNVIGGLNYGVDNVNSIAFTFGGGITFDVVPDNDWTTVLELEGLLGGLTADVKQRTFNPANVQYFIRQPVDDAFIGGYSLRAAFIRKLSERSVIRIGGGLQSVWTDGISGSFDPTSAGSLGADFILTY